tara:strand:- start:424 stop:795 length:372 start_codon:yes stop_codon:yes gene_type:complete
MINQSWTKKNWFSYIRLEYKELNTKKNRFKPTNDSHVFSLNNVSNWTLKNPQNWIYNMEVKPTGTRPAQRRSYFKNVVELTVHMEHSTGRKLNTFFKYEDPETGVLTDQITPFFDAMKKARLM